jgi:3-hydroxybutyryl-CoA dehydrogenase
MLILNKILVIGAGTMGSGIAQWFLQCGLEVHLTDANMIFLESQKNKIFENLEKLLNKNKISQNQFESIKQKFHIIPSHKVDDDYNLIIEAIIEDLQVKKKLFSELDATQNINCIFASNTSSLSIKEISQDLKTERKMNFVGVHFFNPAPIMPLVEIIKTDITPSHLIDQLKTWFEKKSKKVVICHDSPAFIVNRVARNFYGEAMRIAAKDDEVFFKEIDQVMKNVGLFKMGPFELMDLIGIDINLAVTESVWHAFKEHPRFAPHEMQIQRVKNKTFGVKSKKGFYQYE